VAHEFDPGPIIAYRNSWLAALTKTAQPDAVIALGQLAWAQRTDTTAAEKRATITVTIPGSA